MKLWTKIVVGAAILMILLEVISYFGFNATVGIFPIGFAVVPVFFFLISVFLAFFIRKRLKNGEELSARDLLILKGIKLIGVTVIAIVGLLINKENVLYFALQLIVCYVVFLLFETITLLRVNKNKEKN